MRKAPTDYFESVLVQEEGVVALVNENGVVFFANRPSWDFKTLWQLDPDTLKRLQDSRQFGEEPLAWLGLDRNGALVTDRGGTKYYLHQSVLPIDPPWNVVFLHDMDYLSQYVTKPILISFVPLIAVLILLTGVAVAFLSVRANASIRQRRTLERELQAISITDELTGLYNRRGFLKFAEHHLHLANRNGECLAIYYFDLDGMKQINDTFGHAQGDRALRDMANILLMSFRKSDVIARLGGDEFTVLMTCKGIDNLTLVEERIANSVSTFNRDGIRPYTLSVSVGMVVYDPKETTTLEQLLAKADEMMYEKKIAKKSETGHPSSTEQDKD